MASFKLPAISPLAGARLSTLLKVLKGNRIAYRFWLKMGVTSILVLLVSILHWIDRLVFKRAVTKFSFKESPLFIIGPWRSGTTFLHNILTKDPAASFLTTYHSVFPNNLKSKWLFKNFMRIFMPSERPGDQMKISVNLPQEDEYAVSNTTHRSFYHFFYFPTTFRSLYKKYVRFESLTEGEQEEWALRYRQLIIKALINTGGKRAILKNPVNTARMRPLAQIFPGAQFIFLIRNPLIVYLSTKKFFGELFPTVNLEPFSEEELSDMILDLYSSLIRDYLKDKKRVNSRQILEVRFEDLQKSPLKEVEKIYRHFGYANFRALKSEFQNYINTLNGHSLDTYSIDQEELDRVSGKLEFAMKHWSYDLPEDLSILNRRKEFGEEVLAV